MPTLDATDLANIVAALQNAEIDVNVTKWLDDEVETLDNGYVPVNVWEWGGAEIGSADHGSIPAFVDGTIRLTCTNVGFSPTATTFDTNYTSTTDDFVNGQVLVCVESATPILFGQARTITDFVGSNGRITVSPGFTSAPTAGDRFIVIPAVVGSGGGSAPTAADIADAVWDEARSGHTTAGTFGQGAASVQGNVTGSVGSVASGGISASSFASGAVDATAFAQAAADKVWSTATRALTDKAGFALSSAGVQAVWDALTSALTTSGSIGKRLADNVDAAVSTRSSHTAANVRTEMDANSTKLANLDATVSTRATPADVSTQVGAGITAKLQDIAQAVLLEPLANVEVAARGIASLASVVQRLRNKVARTASSVWTIYERDGTTAAWTETVTTDSTQDPPISSTPSS